MRTIGGFSLIELMIVVAVVAIVAVIAVPSYSAYVIRGKRAEAKTALLQTAQYLERNFSQAGCYNYTDAPSCSAQSGNAVGFPASGSATDYVISPVPALASQTYVLNATPCGSAGGCANSAFTDPDCGALTLDNTGAKGALNASALTTATAAPGSAALAAIQQCWQR